MPYKSRPDPNISRRILVAKEKHDTRYFDARSEHALGESALKLLKERIDPQYGYITDPGPVEDWTKGEETFTDEEIAALPESLRKTAIDKRRRYKAEVRTWEEFKQDWLDAKKAVRTKDGALALDVIKRRSDRGHEYETIRFDYLE